MSATLQMFRPVLRRIAATPLFTGLVILTLAPGVGAHVAIFSLVNVLFLRPLPVEDAGRIVGLYQTREGGGYFPLSLPDYQDYREGSTIFSALAAHYPTAPLTLTNGNEIAEINGSVVTANYFSLLGIEPALGRFFLPEEDAAPGAGPVVVLSHELWQSRFGRRPDIIGQVLRLNNTPFTVVGVAPERFDGVLLGIPSNVWLPSSMAAVGYRWCDARARDCTWLTMIGRLRPGRTLDEAQAEMNVLSGRLATADPETHQGLGVRATPLRGVHPTARTDTLRLAALLIAGVTLVLAVACANVSGLLLVRSLTRRKEIAIRLAIGATRSGVISTFVAEGLVLALLGGAAGVLLASWFGRVIVSLYPSDVPLELGIDRTVIGYVVLLSALIGLIVGLVPGLQSTRPNLAIALKEEVTASAQGRPRLLGLLIVVQVALSFVLLTCTGLLARSVDHVDRGGGIDPQGVLTARLRPRLIEYTPQQGQAISREALRRLMGLPGVRAVSLAVALPPRPSGDRVPIGLPGQEPIDAESALTAELGEIAPRFFATLGVPLLRGRDFDDRDTAGAAPVAIVSQTLGERLWPGREAVGRRLVVQGQSHEVVGVVPDLGARLFGEPAAAQVYLPYWQNAGNVDARLCLRAGGDLARLIPAVRRELRALDPNLPVVEVQPMTSSFDRYFGSVRTAGRVLGASAGLALFLGSVGLYGMLSLAVVQSTRDLGIRMALGASRRHVVALVLRDAALLVASALALGLVVALGASRLLTHYLYGVSPRDPLTFTLALALLAPTAALASWMPARRASRIDPLVAIRQEA